MTTSVETKADLEPKVIDEVNGVPVLEPHNFLFRMPSGSVEREKRFRSFDGIFLTRFIHAVNYRAAGKRFETPAQFIDYCDAYLARVKQETDFELPRYAFGLFSTDDIRDLAANHGDVSDLNRYRGVRRGASLPCVPENYVLGASVEIIETPIVLAVDEYSLRIAALKQEAELRRNIQAEQGMVFHDLYRIDQSVFGIPRSLFDTEATGALYITDIEPRLG